MRKHCDKLRNEVDLNAETTILAVQNNRDEILKKINEYKQMYEDNIKQNRSIINEKRQLICKTTQFINDW